MEIFLAAAAILVIAFALFILTRPKTFRVARSAQIDAPADVVFPFINDFREWTKWSPWEKRDPNLQRTYDGPAAGPGAVYSWVGNREVGEGRMTLMDSKPGDFVALKLEFLKPFAATNQTLFKLTPINGGTRVDWSMEGKNTFMGKVISLFMNMDKMIGKDFEQGLASMNVAAQSLKN